MSETSEMVIPLEIGARVPPLEDLRQCDMPSLINYVLARFHDRHREQLPELMLLAQTVESVHAMHPACPNGLASLLGRIQFELDSHMMKEERVLFPMLLRGMRAHAVGPISVMKAEHEHHETAMREMMQITRNLTLPEDACGTWRHLYEGIGDFADDLQRHIELENEVVFA